MFTNIPEELKKIADYYGYEEQSEQLIEECAELIQAINKYRRAMNRGTIDERGIAIDHLIEELSDVEIMLEQIKYLLQIPLEEMQAMKFYKINRAKENIAKERAGKRKGE